MGAQYLISLGIEKGTEAQQTILDFTKYIWEHKDDDLYLQKPFELKKKVLQSPLNKEIK
jgi:hypothetical protein